MTERTNSYSGPIAVIGISCRVPGADDSDRMWKNVVSGVDSLHRLTREQAFLAGTSLEEWNHEDYVPVSGLVDRAEYFDAEFFGISPASARLMDPQLRVALQSAWTAFDDAGYAPGRHLGRVGVYLGASLSTYMLQHFERGRVADTHGGIPTLIASDKDHVASSIAYRLDLTGPAVAVGTACSSSLVAVHLACQALRSGDAEIALAGGVSLFFPQGRGYRYQLGGIYSRNGRCRAFDRDADGVTPGSGVAMVLLKPLSHATRDRDHVYAVIRGSAIGNDGAEKAGYVAPSEHGQVRTIVEALENAGVEPQDIDMVEAHGTATALGDGVELAALNRVFAKRSPNRPCAIGSVKTNIGHLDAAAGAISLIKAVRAIEAGVIPPSLHYEAPNPELEASGRLFVPTVATPWPAYAMPRRAGVSSFGMGGTNAHVVLEQVPASVERLEAGDPVLIVISARTEQSLKTYAARIADRLEQDPRLGIADVAYTLARRSHFSVRRSAIVANVDQAVDWCRSISQDREAANITNTDATLAQVRERWLSGAEVNWIELYRHRDVRAVPMPGYPFAGELHTIAELAPPPTEVLPWLLEQKLLARHEASPLVTIESRGGLSRALDALCASAAYWFLADNGGIDSGGRLVDPSNFMDRLGVLPSFHALVAFLYQLVEEDHLLEAGLPPRPDELADEVVRSFPEFRDLVAMLLRCVRRYPEVLTQPGAGLETLYSDSPSSPLRRMLERTPEHSDTSRVLSGVADAVGALAHSRAEGIRILEVGAGTGGLTRKLVPAIVGTSAELMITDISGAFVSRLAQQFGARLGMDLKFESLDLLRPMGVAVRQWDVVLAHDVLHATNDPARAADNLLAFLKPGGVAVVTESVKAYRWLTMIWGVSEQWWSARADGYGPLRNFAAWTRLFTASGCQVRLAVKGGPASGEHADTGVFALSRRVRQEEGTSMPAHGAWIYGPRWREAAVAPASPPEPDIVWIVLADNVGFARRLIEKLSGVIYTVVPGAVFEQTGQSTFTLRPSSAEDFAELLLLVCSKHSSCKLLHCWSLDRTPVNGAGHDSERQRGFDSLLAIGKAFGRLHNENPFEVGVVTTGTSDVLGTEVLLPLNSLLAAPVQLLPREQHNVHAWQLDLDLSEGEVAFDRAVDMILAGFGCALTPPLTALRGSRVWCEAFEPLASVPTREAAISLTRSGRYVVLGGLGGIGLELSRELARAGDAHLILTARSAPDVTLERSSDLAALATQRAVSESTLQALEQLLSSGARISLKALDIAVPNAIRTLLEQVKAQFGPINGIVHCAGVPDFGGVMMRRESEQTEAALAAKVAGGLELDAAITQCELDFVVYSVSIGTLLPNLKFGEVAYVAANDFLSSLAACQARRWPGRVKAIHWTDWKQVGMWADAQQRLREGYAALDGRDEIMPDVLRAISSKEGRDAFVRVLNQSASRVVVCGQPLEALLARHGDFTTADHLAFLERTGLTRHEHTSSMRSNAASELKLRNSVEQRLALIWCELLGLSEIGRDDDFFELGGDSLLALRVLNRLKIDFGVVDTLSALLEATTIAKLAARVAFLRDRSAEKATSEEFEDLEI